MNQKIYCKIICLFITTLFLLPAQISLADNSQDTPDIYIQINGYSPGSLTNETPFVIDIELGNNGNALAENITVTVFLKESNASLYSTFIPLLEAGINQHTALRWNASISNQTLQVTANLENSSLESVRDNNYDEIVLSTTTSSKTEDGEEGKSRSTYISSWREAESWDRSLDTNSGNSWEINSYSTASNQEYSKQINNLIIGDYAEWDFTVYSADTYSFWVRHWVDNKGCKNISLSWGGNSIGSTDEFYKLFGGEYWQWTEIGSSYLSNGSGTLHLETEDAGILPGGTGLAEIDNILITNNPTYTPSGTGVEGSTSSCIGENTPPYTPNTPIPEDDATQINIYTSLNWSGGDPDGETVYYDVYLESNDASPDIQVSTDQTTTTYAPTQRLSCNTHYYWQIIATDEGGETTQGPIWDFYTAPATQPNVTSHSTGSIGSNQMKLYGKLTDDGGESCSCYLTVIGEQTAYCGEYTTGETFNYSFTGLQPETTYQWYASAENTAGSATGETKNFTTAPIIQIPDVCCLTVLDEGRNWITLQAQLSDDGGEPCTCKLSITGVESWTKPGTYSEIHEFSHTFSDLEPGVEYQAKARVNNSDGGKEINILFTLDEYGLDNQTMKDITQELSYIIKYYEFTDHLIYKGRDFGSPGERESIEIIYKKMNDFTSNLTMSTEPTKELIGDEDSGDLSVIKHINDKMVVTGYDISLKNGVGGNPIVIPNNESFPFPSKIDGDTETTGTNGYVRVLSLENEESSWAQCVKTGNVSESLEMWFSDLKLTPIGDGELLHTEELVYYQNYSNVTIEEARGKIHLINPISIQEYNETLQTLAGLNASGFIITYTLVDSIKNYSTAIPGAALPLENWTQLKELTINETVGIQPSNPANLAYGTYNNNLTELSINVFSYNQTNTQQPTIDGSVVYLINSSEIDWIVFQIFNNIVADILAVCSGYKDGCAGFIFYDNTHNDSHFNNPTCRVFYKKRPVYLSGSQYSWAKHPSMSINGSILVDGQMTDVETWVENNEIYVDFSIDQQKDPAVQSYNVYCDVQGIDTSRTVIFSGGHHDGWWGQMSIDNAVGPAIMLGILKYYNDNKIIPPCNIRFISHGGEEYGFRGSISHVFNPDNFDVLEDTSYIINLDQLCHNFPNSLLRINCSDDDIRTNVSHIVNQTNYSKHFPEDNAVVKGKVSTSVDCRPYYDYRFIPGSAGVKIDHINFCNNEFPAYHHSGCDHSAGDAMDVLDWYDLNITAEVILNVTQYVLTADKPQTGVAPLPSMLVTPGSFDFGVLPVNVTNATTFEVRNDGSGVLGYVVDEDCSWIKVTPISGSSSGESDPIDVEINTSGLSIGEHSYNISLLADDCSEVFTISVRVVDSDSPILSYSPTSHNFSDMMEGLTNSTTFEIWNSGEATLNYTLYENSSWLTVSPLSGNSTGEHDTITVEVNTSGLIPNHYQETIQINYDSYFEMFTVEVTVVGGSQTTVDQQQTTYNANFSLIQSSCAQSFIPTVSNLSQIELFVGRVGNPTSDLTVSIRETLTSKDITSISLSGSEISTTMNWTVFDVADLNVTIGQRYYIVVTSSGTLSDYYKVGYCNTGNPYTNGSMYQQNQIIGIKGGGVPLWQILTYSDLCFKTYGG